MSELILSIETGSSNCSVALSESGNLIAEYSANGKNLHDRLLAEFTSRILNDFKIKINMLDAIAVSSGPGSFTGLRIGVSFAKGLCFEGHPKLISVPTLTAVANNYVDYAKLYKATKIVSVIHSHKDLFYYQIFDLELNELSGIMFDTELNLTNPLDYNCLVCSNFQFQNITANRIDFLLSASLIAKYGFCLYANSQFISDVDLIPVYIQEFVPKGF